MRCSVAELVAKVRLAKARERAERVAVLRLFGSAPAPIVVPVLAGWAEGWTMLVHRDLEADAPERWRVTRFDAKGEASGHTRLEVEGRAGFSRALRAVQEWGGDLRFARIARAMEER